MPERYKPPFTITEEITNLVIEIAEMAGFIAFTDQLSKNLALRKDNRIHSIHSSLAIERNSLSIEQVGNIINGKRVLGPPKDIREVQNAYDAYEMLTKLDPYSIEDLLTAHKIMMLDLVKEAGVFRSSGVGVFEQEQLIHAGTPPQYVPDLISDLFQWLKNSTVHPLIKSCIFHYEFEFIHPFADGNGRTGRLWHTLILAKWKEFFLWLPIETLIHEQQEGYYHAINQANTEGESTIFITFMLNIMKQTLIELTLNIEPNEDQNHNSMENRLLELLKLDHSMSAKNAAEKLHISQRQVQRLLKKMKDEGRIERVGTNKSGSWTII